MNMFWQTDWWKTIRFNFHYFPFLTALKLPILVSRRTAIRSLKGRIELRTPVRRGLLKLGYCGLGTQDMSFERTIWEVEGTIILYGPVSFDRGCRISVSGQLTLGAGFTVTGGSTLICKKAITIGEGCRMSWDILLMDTDFHPIYDDSMTRVNPDREIRIGDRVWIGCRATLLKGAVIPSGSVIAASSVITGVLEKENAVYGGNGRLLREQCHWQVD